MEFNAPAGNPAQLLGRYRLLDLLGRGGSAAVYKARDCISDRDVALKVASARPDDESAIDRLIHEAAWLSQCDHPHIVQIHATGRIDGLQYIAMELMATTLDVVLATTRLSLDAVVEYGAGILLGLAAAHRLGIIHGDIKPANIGLGVDGLVKLLDFGAAGQLPWSVNSDLATHRVPSGTYGTLAYMAPEQLRGDAGDERSDVYGVGAVLYELATGRRPFAAVHTICLVDSILNSDPPPPSAFGGTPHPQFDALVLRALAKEPSARFPSAHAMLDDLLLLHTASRETPSAPVEMCVSCCPRIWRPDDASSAIGPLRSRIDASAAGTSTCRRR